MIRVTQENINQASDIIFAGAVGYLCARAFAIVNPVHAAAFCVFSTIFSRLVNSEFEKLFNGPGANTSAKIVGALSITAVGIIFPAYLLSIPLTTVAILIATVVATQIFIVAGFNLAKSTC